MDIRLENEAFEKEKLSPYACRADQTQGRVTEKVDCPVRTCFQRDADRIIHSKAFRRLMHKTQVFLQPEGDHYRTRMTHTLEVARIASTITRALGLNEDLAEAIAMGHDLGHTPFGTIIAHLHGFVNPFWWIGIRCHSREDISQGINSCAEISKCLPIYIWFPRERMRPANCGAHK